METKALDALFASGLTRDGEQVAWKAEAAELSALKQRCDDLELMLRRFLRYEGGGCGIFATNRWRNEIALRPQIRGPFYLDGVGFLQDDGTGLPILTDEARAALKSEGQQSVYSHPECVFNYCPSPKECEPGCNHKR